MFGDGKQAMQPVFIDDVARVIVDAALSPVGANKLLELGGPGVMSLNDVVRTTLAAAGMKRALLHQPALFGKALGALAALLPSPPLSADAIDFITSPAVADNSAVLAALAPRLTPLRDGLATYLPRA
jgi:NADH dehydrogenase